MDDHILLTTFRKLNVKLHDQRNILYKYVNLKDAKLILGDQTIFLQTAENFNDPFELHLGFIEPSGLEDFLELLKKQHLYTPELEGELRAIGEETFKESNTKALLGCRSTYGIYCMSKINDSTLMWSHYADKHKGVCIGFKVPTMSGPTITVEVKYEDEITPLEHSFETSGTSVKWMCSKSKVWEYENEVRMIDISYNGIFPFHKSNLCEIYFGVATPSEEIEAIKALIKQKGYPITKSGKLYIKKCDFKLAIEEFKL